MNLTQNLRNSFDRALVVNYCLFQYQQESVKLIELQLEFFTGSENDIISYKSSALCIHVYGLELQVRIERNVVLGVLEQFMSFG